MGKTFKQQSYRSSPTIKVVRFLSSFLFLVSIFHPLTYPAPPLPPQGLLPNIYKLAPAAGIGWYVFEETKLLLGEDPHT
jgi:hypothetical protein